VLDKGSRNVEILKQAQFSPVTVEKQTAIIYLGTTNAMRSIPVNKIRAFEAEYLAYLEKNHRNVLDGLAAGKFDDEITSTLNAACTEVSKNYSA